MSLLRAISRHVHATVLVKNGKHGPNQCRLFALLGDMMLTLTRFNTLSLMTLSQGIKSRSCSCYNEAA